MRTNNPVCGAFRGFGANQAQFAMEGVHRPPGRAGRHQRLGDAPAQRDPARRRVGPGPDHGRRLRAAPARCLDAVTPAYDAARGRRPGRRPRPRAEELRARQRVPGDRQGGGALPRRRHASRCATAGPRWARASTPWPSRWPSTELGVDPERIEVIVDTTRELGAGQTTGSRGTLMGAGSVADACQAALADGCRPEVDYEGEYRVDWTNKISDGLEHPIIHSAFGYAAQLVIIDRDTGDIEQGRRRPRRRPGRQPAAVRGPDRGRGAHGPRLRPDRGLPRRRDRAGPPT